MFLVYKKTEDVEPAFAKFLVAQEQEIPDMSSPDKKATKKIIAAMLQDGLMYFEDIEQIQEFLDTKYEFLYETEYLNQH